MLPPAAMKSDSGQMRTKVHSRSDIKVANVEVGDKDAYKLQLPVALACILPLGVILMRPIRGYQASGTVPMMMYPVLCRENVGNPLTYTRVPVK